MVELLNNVAPDIKLSSLLSQRYSEFCVCFKPKELFSSVCFAIVFRRFKYFSTVFTRLNLFVAVRLVVIIKFQVVLFTLVWLWYVEIHHMAPVAVQLHGTELKKDIEELKRVLPLP